MPLARRIDGAASPVPDGYALDTLLQTGVRFHRPEVLDAPDPRTGSRALFESLRQYGLADRALEPRFRTPIVERSREQFMAAVRRVEGHPSQPILALYAARTVRGISTYPSGLLGQDARVLVPGASDPVVSAILSVSSADKRTGMHRAIQAHLTPQLAGFPSTGDTARVPPRLPRRWRSEQATAMHRARLTEGPLSPYLSAELRDWLADPTQVDPSPDLRLGIEAVSLLHSWWNRYRDRLRDPDPTDLLA